MFDPNGPRNPRAYNQALAETINKTVPDDSDRKFLKTALVMNESLLKTNFYKERKSSLSFRFDPSVFIDGNDRFAETPYGIFMLLGSDFRGFHVRFRDVARGGIRLIPSRDAATYARNRQMVFAENYGLAHTQNAKNKDIPEFGSKGTILLERSAQNAGRQAFYKYISGIFDLLLPKDEVVDHYAKEEILFLGPDEGTADVMEWACDYARLRGYPYWKSITTGKPPSMGGIPHDTYGMTTLSVHEYAKGVLEKKGEQQESITKLQTGGPDGDLGSNEVLISRDMTTSVVDGSGVLHDPSGIDRGELNRLAEERVMIEAFDMSRLGPNGFRVLVNENDVTLPSGTTVSDGVRFRNSFHLNPIAKADLFVPCGGRPESINASNVNELFDAETGEPNFKYIVEGANLFITEDARATLEAAGVVLFKDASTNKGGVTSSSLEVLAALALTDAEFDEHMRVPDNDVNRAPQFYNEYVQEITEIIKDNARQEFEILWQEHDRTGIARHRLTDQISGRINELNVAVQSSTLWQNLDIRRRVLSKAFPQKLQELVGLDQLIDRLPEAYQQAVFGYYIASRYVYQHGLSGQEFAFFEYMSSYTGPE